MGIMRTLPPKMMPVKWNWLVRVKSKQTEKVSVSGDFNVSVFTGCLQRRPRTVTASTLAVKKVRFNKRPYLKAPENRIILSNRAYLKAEVQTRSRKNCRLYSTPRLVHV